MDSRNNIHTPISTSELKSLHATSIKDVILPDIKFVLLANNTIRMNQWLLTFKTMVILIQCVHHV